MCALLAHPVPLAPTPLGASCQLQEYGPVAFVSNLALFANGSELVEVADNGSGVDPANYQALTLKYHTSKARALSRAPRPRPGRVRGPRWCALSSFQRVRMRAPRRRASQ